MGERNFSTQLDRLVALHQSGDLDDRQFNAAKDRLLGLELAGIDALEVDTEPAERNESDVATIPSPEAPDGAAADRSDLEIGYRHTKFSDTEFDRLVTALDEAEIDYHVGAEWLNVDGEFEARVDQIVEATTGDAPGYTQTTRSAAGSPKAARSGSFTRYWLQNVTPQTRSGWRGMTWLIIAFNLGMAAWAISAAANGAESCAGETTLRNACETGAEIGTTISLAIIAVFWAAGSVVLGVLWLVTGQRDRGFSG